MRPIREIRGRAAPYPKSNVDTDEIVPARFLFRDRSEGFADTLFRDLRFDAEGNERADFILNQANCRNPKTLVTGPNFGCGSSREHAVWALLDYGIDAVISTSFGDIFRNNALQNGLLPIVLPTDAVAALLDSFSKGVESTIHVNLEEQRVIAADGQGFDFSIDAHDKQNLLNGLSKIAKTLTLRAEIERFERQYQSSFPWAI